MRCDTWLEKNFSFFDFFFALWTKSKKISFFVVCQWKIYGRWWKDVNEHNELVPSGNIEEIDHDRKYERFIVFFVTFLHIYQLFFLRRDLWFLLVPWFMWSSFWGNGKELMKIIGFGPGNCTVADRTKNGNTQEEGGCLMGFGIYFQKKLLF